MRLARPSIEPATHEPMTNADRRLRHADAEQLSDDDLFWDLMAPAWDDASRGTVGQRLLAVTSSLVRDVSNGGFHQALWNREADAWEEAVVALQTLGATEHASAARDASRLLLGDDPPRALEERRQRLDGMDRSWVVQHVGPLDERMYDETRLWPHYRAYIAGHPDEFFSD
jgi:hypothetical protein